MKLIFLDIDGVMNGSRPFENGYYGIEPVPAHLLSTLLRLTDADLVIHSAWRYLILTNAMTQDGFANLLSSHGVTVWKGPTTHRAPATHRVIGITRADSGLGSRRDCARQIIDYVHEVKPEKWLAIDNLKLNLDPDHFIQTDKKTGFTAEDFLRALDILGREAT